MEPVLRALSGLAVHSGGQAMEGGRGRRLTPANALRTGTSDLVIWNGHLRSPLQRASALEGNIAAASRRSRRTGNEGRPSPMRRDGSFRPKRTRMLSRSAGSPNPDTL